MTRSAEDAREGAGGEFQIVIAEDGRVIFRTATADMLELALALAPDDPKLQRRAARRTPAGERDE